MQKFVALALLLAACGDGDGSASNSNSNGSSDSSTTLGPGSTGPVDDSSGAPTGGPASTSTTSTTGEPSSTSTSEATTSSSSDTTGAPLACKPGFFCEDFEAQLAGAAPGAPWQLDIGSGSATVEAGKAVSGANAVHLITGDAYGGRALMTVDVPEVFPSDHLFGRLRMWLDAASPDGVHWTMIEASGQTQAPGVWNDQPFAATIRYGGQHQQRLMANYDTPGFYNQTGPGSDCWNHSQTPIPTQAWACMEWEFDAAQRTMRFWLDGAEVADLTVGGMGQGCVNDGTQGQWYYPQLERMSFGWVDYQSGGARELWLDDIAVGPERVGCD